MTPITKLIPTLSLVLALGVFVSSAHADPCKAIPDRGPTAPWVRALTRPGVVFSGTARYVVDGDGICLSDNPYPASWVEYRLADFYAPELHEPGGQAAKRALEAITAGRRVFCTATKGANGRTKSFDRIVGRCTLDGKPIGDLLRARGIVEGGRGR